MRNSHKEFFTLLQNSPSPGEKVRETEGFSGILFLHEKADMFPYFELLNA